MTLGLVWFKRDLRWEDHEALAKAAAAGPVRCVYIVEPGYWSLPDTALQHFEFIRESLNALDEHLRQLGGSLEIYPGEAIQVLQQLLETTQFTHLYSHEETGNAWTYKRDIEVKQWCKTHQVTWHEFPQFGVVRGLRQRKQWQPAWERHMQAPQAKVLRISFDANLIHSRFMMAAPLHLKHNPPRRQRGGRPLALATLNSFLNARSIGYRGGISSPLTAPDACSRLSAYLAYGCISMREVVQMTRAYLEQLPPQATRHRASLQAFISRLYWHCHFIQKLESEPEIEWQNMHRGYDLLREQEFDLAHFEALKNARTGWPMVDASVIMLRETGWLNFRMRAMLVSVAAYPLWLHWRPVGEWLATQFLDYEPGIHWSQLQMQSGTTGINTTRVYNPIKQAQDHDPYGKFVRRWLPSLRSVPATWLFEPWKMPDNVKLQAIERTAQCLEIHQPLVDLTNATRLSKERVHARRKLDDVKAGKQAVIEKHASQKTTASRRLKTKTNVTATTTQMGFDF
jgi:deoxyribodipyrimidine photo-lyase